MLNRCLLIVTDERQYAKTGQQIFVGLIPKEGLAALSPSKLSFGMTLMRNRYPYRIQITINLWIIGVVPKEGLPGLVPAKPSFSMTMTTILKCVFTMDHT